MSAVGGAGVTVEGAAGVPLPGSGGVSAPDADMEARSFAAESESGRAPGSFPRQSPQTMPPRLAAKDTRPSAGPPQTTQRASSGA